MRRVNSPGCYCCEQGPPEERCPTACCDENEDWPTFNPGPSWGLRQRSIDAECCCVTEVYDVVGNRIVAQCCDEAGTYRYKQWGSRNDYAWKKTADQLMLATQCAPPTCPTECCQSGTPDLISTWTDTFEDVFTYYFGAKIYIEELEIKYSKELIQCPGEEEPVCRYVLKYTLFGRYEAAIFTEQVATYKRELTYLHPCWEYTPQFPTTCPPLANSILCEFDITPISSCIDPEDICKTPIQECCQRSAQDDTLPPECFYQSQNFCVQRIKYFDEPPTGSVGFTDSDVNAQPDENPDDFCDEPRCGTNCPQGEIYITEISVSSGTPAPPLWYTTPPTKVTTTYNILVEWDWCNNPSIGWLYNSIFAPLSCCDESMFGSAFCDPSQCENPTVTVTITCEDFTDPRLGWPAEDPNACELKTTWLIDASPADSCGAFPGQRLSGRRSIFNNTLTAGPSIIRGASIVGNEILCQFPNNGPWDQIGAGCGPWDGFCIRYKAANGEPCDDECFATRFCECFCECVPLFAFYGWHSSNTANFETSGEWEEKECSYDNFNLTIDISY